MRCAGRWNEVRLHVEICGASVTRLQDASLTSLSHASQRYRLAFISSWIELIGLVSWVCLAPPSLPLSTARSRPLPGSGQNEFSQSPSDHQKPSPNPTS